jgi:hypothetical protein
MASPVLLVHLEVMECKCDETLMRRAVDYMTYSLLHVMKYSPDEALSANVSEVPCFLRVMQAAALPTLAPTSCVHITLKQTWRPPAT